MEKAKKEKPPLTKQEQLKVKNVFRTCRACDLDLTQDQFNVLARDANNKPAEKILAQLERYQSRNQRNERIANQKSSEQQMGYDFSNVVKPDRADMMRKVSLTFSNATKVISTASIMRGSQSKVQAKGANIMFTDKSQEIRYYVPGGQSRSNPVDVDEMEQHKRSLTYDFDDLEFPKESQELPPCEKEPAPAPAKAQSRRNAFRSMKMQKLSPIDTDTLEPTLCSRRPEGFSGRQRNNRYLQPRVNDPQTPPRTEHSRPKCYRGRRAEYPSNVNRGSAEEDADNAYLSNYLNYNKGSYPRRTDSDLDQDEYLNLDDEDDICLNPF